MAARLRPQIQQEVRDRIKASQLINRLEDHAFGSVELLPTQIKAIEILLKKCLADLQALTISGDSDNPLEHKHHNATDAERAAAVMALIAKAK